MKNASWAAALPVSVPLDRVAPLRQPSARIEIAEDPEDDGLLWLRGDTWDEETLARVRQIPVAGVYQSDENGRLTPLGCRLPDRKLTGLSWQLLDAWLRIAFPRAALPSRSSNPGIPLRLVRETESCHSPNLIVASIGSFRRYAEKASQVRLDPLRFALADDGSAIIAGEPLPSIRGSFYRLDDNVAVPLGYRLDPLMTSEAMRRLLALASHEIALVHREPSLFERLQDEDFLPASRSSIRLSCESVAEQGETPVSAD